MIKFVALYLGVKLLGWLPRGAVYAIADFIAWGGYLLKRGERDTVHANLRRVMGGEARDRDVGKAARSVFRNVMRYYADLVLLPRLDPKTFYQEHVVIHGLDNLWRALAAGKGVIVASAHYGAPEVAAQSLLPLNVRLLSMTEPLSPPAMSRLVHRLRGWHGLEFSPVGYSGIKEAIRRLRSGGAVALLFDRDIQGTGRPLPFFGADARFPVGVADIAVRTGAAVLPVFTARYGHSRFEAWVEPPIEITVTGNDECDLRENTLRLVARLEEYLRRDPGQWAVSDRVWPEELASDLHPRPLSRSAGEG